MLFKRATKTGDNRSEASKKETKKREGRDAASSYMWWRFSSISSRVCLLLSDCTVSPYLYKYMHMYVYVRACTGNVCMPSAFSTCLFINVVLVHTMFNLEGCRVRVCAVNLH